MGRAGFVEEIEIDIPPSRLHDFLCDLHNAAPLHPLIVSIDDLPADPERPRARRYRIVDRIPVGPLRLRAAYVATIESVSTHEIQAHAWQSPGVHLETTYELQEHGSGTRLRESVSIEAPWLLRGFVARQASRAHRAMLANMKSLLEAPGDAPPSPGAD